MAKGVFIPKTESHWYEESVNKMKHFALLLVDKKDYIHAIFGEHWSNKGPTTKQELQKVKTEMEEMPDSPYSGNPYRFVWVKTDHGEMFWETDEENIPDAATTKLEKYLIIYVDEYGDKSISENPIKDEFDLWKQFYRISSKVADLESHWRVYDKSRVPEIYKLQEGFIAQKLEDCWESYDIVSDAVEYNAAQDKKMCDAIIEEKKAKGDKCWEFITMGEAFQHFLSMFEN